MTRGLGGQSPANISHHLHGIDFPSDKEGLIHKAKENGADADVLDRIESMPEQEYTNMADVMKGYGETSHGGDGQSRGERSVGGHRTQAESRSGHRRETITPPEDEEGEQ